MRIDKQVFVHGETLNIVGLSIMTSLQPASPPDADHIPAYDEESDYMDLKSFLVPEYESPEGISSWLAPSNGIERAQLGMPSVVETGIKPGSFSFPLHLGVEMIQIPIVIRFHLSTSTVPVRKCSFVPAGSPQGAEDAAQNPVQLSREAWQWYGVACCRVPAHVYASQCL